MTIAVIDIGTSTIKTLIAKEEENGQLNIIGFSRVKNTGLRKSNIVDIDTTISAVKRSVAEAELMAGVKNLPLYASIGGENVLGFTATGMVVISNSGGISHNDVLRVIEQTKTSTNMDDNILHILPVSYTVDEQPDIKNPVGLTGNKLQTETLIIAVPNITIQNFSSAIDRAGYNYEDFIVQHVAAYNSVLDSEEKELGVALVDIGGGTIKVSVFYNDSLRYVDTIKIGGDNITQDLSIGLRTPKEDAERIKTEYANCIKDFNDTSGEIIIPGIHDREDRKVTMDQIIDIVQPRVLEMLDLIKDSLHKSMLYDKLNTGIVLTGGTASLKGLRELSEKHLDIPVKIGYPRKLSGLADNIYDPSFAVATGMVVYVHDMMKKPRIMQKANNTNARDTFGKMMKSIKDLFNL